MKTNIKCAISLKTMALIMVPIGVSGCAVDQYSGTPVANSHSPEQVQGNVPNGSPKDWVLVPSLSDEFNGTKVNTSKWDISPQSWGAWTWKADNTKVNSGNLDITMRYDDNPNATLRTSLYTPFHAHTYFSSGILKSKATQVFGYYEARIKGVAKFPGSSPAFWLYSNNVTDEAAGFLKHDDNEQAYSEVDIVEMQQHAQDSHILDMHAPYQVMKDGKATWVRNAQQLPYLDHPHVNGNFDPAAAFHVYGAMVEPDRITYYLDGKEVNSLANTNWNRLPMNLALSLGLRAPNLRYSTASNPCPNNQRRCGRPPKLNANGGVDGYPTTMQVDWVRVYKKKPGTSPY
ncbi:MULTISPECIES: family 16 glycosylhydrolase [Marinomonas]|uniref:family 16 glycosylhydrolase n=1 Tax=Marinomonas TaxID=28253 RepID=UPI001404F98D|nr:family 16 glycosylhydrolase [Marinomonas flavescens]